MRVEGGEFLMGSEAFYPEEGPVRRTEVGGFWIDEHPVTAAEFRRFVRETGYVTRRRAAARPRRLPGRRSGPARAGLARLPQDLRPRAAGRRPQLVGVRAGRVLEEAGRAGHDDQRPGSPPRRPGRLRGRRGVRLLDAARHFRPRPSGSTRHAAASTEPRSPGATSTSRTGSRWRTPGRASSPGRT